MKIIESSYAINDTPAPECSLILGISINNSYFKESNLEKLITWASNCSNHVYIMIPDEPAIHTLLAFGYSLVDAKRIARLKANSLANKCSKIISTLDTQSTFRIIRWVDIVDNPYYKNAYHIIEKAYEHDRPFRQAVRESTRAVLDNFLGTMDSKEEDIDKGVIFLLKELAFILFSNQILEEKKIAYVYHKTMNILKDILDGNYMLDLNPNIGFLTVE